MKHKKRKFYCCGTDFLHERDFKVFESVELLKETVTCWEECGIVEFEIDSNENINWVVEQNMILNPK